MTDNKTSFDKHFKLLHLHVKVLQRLSDNYQKAFDRVPRKVIWWALRKLGVDEWIVCLVQGMYSNARSHVRVGEEYSE